MELSTKIILSIFATIVVIWLTIKTRSNTFRVERERLIVASPEKIADALSNFSNDLEWNPFMRIDPMAVQIREGARTGEGAVVYWNGKRIGEGSTAILEANDAFLRRITHFIKPKKNSHSMDFILTPKIKQTHVVWVMYGQRTFIEKAIGIFKPPNKVLDEPLTKGLADLAAFVEE